MKQKKSPAKRTTSRKQPKRKVSGFSRWLSVPRHKFLAIGLVFVVIFSGVGLWQLNSSEAATPSGSTCYLLGRLKRTGSTLCSSQCISGAGNMVTGSYYNYCSGAISKSTGSSECSSLKRRYVYNTGCARRWQQTKLYNAAQCVDSGASTKYTYFVSSTKDRCAYTYNYPTPGGGTTSTAWRWPVNATNIPLSQCFRKPGHAGIDINLDYVSVYAAKAGTVKAAGYNSAGGNYIIISHSGGLYSNYQHLSKLGVSTGKYVNSGAYIGVSGNTGNSSGAHLHFGITTQNGLDSRSTVSYSVNPMNYLPRSGKNITGGC